MIEIIIAILIVVSIKHFFKGQSKSFNQSELKELIENRSTYRAKSKVVYW